MLIALISALQASPSLPARDPCLDDNGRNTCSTQVTSEVLTRMGVETIEAEQASGAEVYRVRHVDGYGRDMPVIAFVRRPGSGPMVEVSGTEGRKLVAAIPVEMWGEVRSESRFVDRQLVPRDGETAPICLHSWLTRIEMANTYLDGREAGPVRTVAQSSCDGGMAVAYGFKLASWAKAALPPCEPIDAQQVRGDVGVLALCLTLEGDKATAASLFNAHNRGGPRLGVDRTDAYAWRAYLGTNGSPRLDWDGQTVTTDRQRNNHVAEFIAGRVGADAGIRFVPMSYKGLTARQGEIRGEVQTGDGRKAPYRQVWVWDANLHGWMLESWTVEGFSSTN